MQLDNALVLPKFQLRPIELVMARMATALEQQAGGDRLSAGGLMGTFFQERAERRDAGARSNQDHRLTHVVRGRERRYRSTDTGQHGVPLLPCTQVIRGHPTVFTLA